MKLALVRQRYNPYGGAERFVERAVSALADLGVSVTVVARDWTAAPAAEMALLRCDPFYLGRRWRDRSFAQAVCHTLSRQSFDLVQSHERLSCCDVYRAGDGVHAQWLADGDGMAHAGLRLVGGNDHQFAEPFHGLHQIPDAGGIDAVVVGDQDAGWHAADDTRKANRDFAGVE